jgi:probable rRNA maturation factor
MIFIEIQHEETPDTFAKLVEQAAEAALKHQSAKPDVTLTVVLTDDAQLQTLNHDFLGNDSPTDVLSFPSDEPDPETGETYLGDILISMPRAALQALAARHPLQAEMQLLVVHGVLHLLGHDHAESAEKERMWAAQGQILAQLGLENINIRE